MSLTRAGPRAELGGLGGGPAEQLDERGAWRREPLRHLRRHRRVVLRGLALQPPDTGADAAGRDDERRQQQHRQQGDLPRQPEHHGQRQHEGDDVRDDTRQRRREGPLGADDVVVQAADERAGAGAGEEGDGHPLDVVEDPAAQVEDQAFAEAARLQALEQARRRRRGTATTAITMAMPITVAAPSPSTMASTARPARIGASTPSVADTVAKHEERDDGAAVRPGELADPPPRRRA